MPVIQFPVVQHQNKIKKKNLLFKCGSFNVKHTGKPLNGETVSDCSPQEERPFKTMLLAGPCRKDKEVQMELMFSCFLFKWIQLHLRETGL